VKIRRLRPGDEDAVRELAEREPQTQLLADERTIFLVAFDRESPIGFVLVYDLPRRHGDASIFFIYEIEVREDWRHRGVGTALMAELADLARSRGICESFVITDESNEDAMAFYASLGGVREHPDDVVWEFRY
jgi:aminoglycoside 3-N-acetyltransferase I